MVEEEGFEERKEDRCYLLENGWMIIGDNANFMNFPLSNGGGKGIHGEKIPHSLVLIVRMVLRKTSLRLR